MEIDSTGWHRLRGQLAAMRAAHAGIRNEIFSLEAARGRFESDRSRLGVQANQPMSAEAAEAAARAVVEADRRAVALDNELSVLRAQADQIYRRMTALDEILRSVRSWAQLNAVALDGDDDRPATVVMPSLPATARELVPPAQARAAIQPPLQPAASPAWPLARAAGKLFNLGGRDAQH